MFWTSDWWHLDRHRSLPTYNNQSNQCKQVKGCNTLNAIVLFCQPFVPRLLMHFMEYHLYTDLYLRYSFMLFEIIFLCNYLVYEFNFFFAALYTNTRLSVSDITHRNTKASLGHIQTYFLRKLYFYPWILNFATHFNKVTVNFDFGCEL